jgi:hypothetical protein
MAGYAAPAAQAGANAGRVASAHRKVTKQKGPQVLGAAVNQTQNSRRGLNFQIALTPSGHIVHLYNIGGRQVRVDMGAQPQPTATGLHPAPAPAAPAPVLGNTLQDGTGLFDPFAPAPQKGVPQQTLQQRAQDFARRRDALTRGPAKGIPAPTTKQRAQTFSRRQRAARRRASGQRTLNV